MRSLFHRHEVIRNVGPVRRSLVGGNYSLSASVWLQLANNARHASSAPAGVAGGLVNAALTPVKMHYRHYSYQFLWSLMFAGAAAAIYKGRSKPVVIEYVADTKHVLDSKHLIYAGVGEGESGRKVPNLHKYESEGGKRYLYVKGRLSQDALANEMIGHAAIKQIFDKLGLRAPKAFLVQDASSPEAMRHTRAAGDDRQRVSVTLGSESLSGDHSNLERVTGELVKGKFELTQLKNIKGLGCSLVAMCALGHADRHGRNVVVMFDAKGDLHAHPIDYENMHKGVDLDAVPLLNFDWSQSASLQVRHFLDQGALLDMTPWVRMMKATQAGEDCGDKSLYISPDVREALELSITKELLSGQIESTYRALAELTDKDMQSMLKKALPLLTPGTEPYDAKLASLMASRSNCQKHLAAMDKARASTSNEALVAQVMPANYPKLVKGSPAYDLQLSQLQQQRDAARERTGMADILEAELPAARCGM